MQQTSTSAKSGLTQTYALSGGDLIGQGMPSPSVSCFDSSTLRLTGNASDPGMAYEILARVHASGGRVSCASAAPQVVGVMNATITVSNASSAWIVWVGATNYDIDAGTAAQGFSFRGPDPHAALLPLLTSASSQSYASLLAAHQADITSALYENFSLNIGQTPNLHTPTDVLRSQYRTDAGNPYLEWVLFNFGRYLLASSARGVLPANLQGKWANGASNPWSGGELNHVGLHSR